MGDMVGMVWSFGWRAVGSIVGAMVFGAISTVLFGLLPRGCQAWYRRNENLIATVVLGTMATLCAAFGVALVVTGDRIAATPKDAYLGGALSVAVALPVFYFAWRAYSAPRASSSD